MAIALISSLRATMTRLKQKPDKHKLDHFFELLICRIEDNEQDLAAFKQVIAGLNERLNALDRPTHDGPDPKPLEVMQ